MRLHDKGERMRRSVTSEAMAEITEYEQQVGYFTRGEHRRARREARRRWRQRRLRVLRELNAIQNRIERQASLGRCYTASVVPPLTVDEAIEMGIRCDLDEFSIPWVARGVAFVLRSRGFDVARNGSTLYITWGGYEVQDYWSP